MHTREVLVAPARRALLAALLSLTPLCASAAYDFRIDEFTVTKNDPTSGFSGTLFHDSFSDGLVPPSPNFFGVGLPDYGVVGALGPESGGRLRLNSDTGSVTFDPLGNGFVSQIATLRTDVNSGNLMTGLKSDDTFSVTGLFDLVVPLANGDGYGVRLTDRFTGSPFNIGNDHIQLFVIRNFSGVLGISLNAQDFSTGTSTALAFAALDTGHAQIALRLERASASSNDLTASYAYGDGGVLGDFVSFANHATIFHGEGYTRAGFMAFGLAPPIPEPQTYALMLAGLGLLGAATRHRRKRS